MPTWTESLATSFAMEKAFGWIVGLGLRWFSTKIECGVALTRGRESSWWREWREGGSGGARVAEAVAAAGVAGEEEDVFLSLIDG